MSDFGKFCDLCENDEGFKCGCDDNADTTEIKITYDGKPYAILVCTNCEDEATPKVIRSKIQNRLNKYQKLVDDAKELGVTLNIDDLISKKDGLIVATPDTIPIPAQAQAQAPAPTATGIQQTVPKAIIEERLLDGQGNRIRGQQIKSKELQTIEANLHGSGRPITLPKKEVGNTGTTYYSVKRTSDAELQERFRKQAQQSNRNPNDPSTYKSCNHCAGEGHITKMQNGKKVVDICKFCDGAGMLA